MLNPLYFFDAPIWDQSEINPSWNFDVIGSFEGHLMSLKDKSTHKESKSFYEPFRALYSGILNDRPAILFRVLGKESIPIPLEFVCLYTGSEYGTSIESVTTCPIDPLTHTTLEFYTEPIRLSTKCQLMDVIERTFICNLSSQSVPQFKRLHTVKLTDIEKTLDELFFNKAKVKNKLRWTHKKGLILALCELRHSKEMGTTAYTLYRDYCEYLDFCKNSRNTISSASILEITVCENGNRWRWKKNMKRDLMKMFDLY